MTAALHRVARRRALCRITIVPTKVRDAIKRIEDDGWYEVNTVGSHRQFKHPTKPGRVTVAGKMSDDLAPGTWNSILKQAGLK
jgi:predicted RNA binding protein YcfA (HicA-like mRNA interferase family)